MKKVTLSIMVFVWLGIINAFAMNEKPVDSQPDTVSGQSNVIKTRPKEKPVIFSIGGIFGGMASITSEAIDGFSETKFGPGLVYGGSAMLWFKGGLGLEIMGVYYKSKMTENGSDLGTLSQFPVVFNLKWQGKPKKGAGFTGHMDIGMGLVFTKFTKGKGITDLETPQVKINITTNTPFVFDIGMGFDVFFCRQISITADLRLFLYNVTTVWKANELIMEDFEKMHTSNFVYLFGLRYWITK